MTHQPADEATATAWAALGGAPELAARVAYCGPAGGLPSGLPVRELARASVGVCSLAASELLARRNGGPGPAVTIDEGAVATAFVSERQRALTEQLNDGAGRHSRLSLSATADWLLYGLSPTVAPVDATPYDAAPYLTETPSAYGLLRHARTPVAYPGSPVDWAHPPTRWGTDAPAWA